MDNDIRNLEHIHRLFLAFGSASSTVTEPVANEYVRQIDGRPESHVSRVVDKFIAGKVSGQDLNFPPKVPMFSRALDAEPYIGEEEQAWLQRKKAMALPRPERYSNPDHETDKERWRRIGRKHINSVLADWEEVEADATWGWEEREAWNQRRVAEYRRRTGGLI